MTGWELRKAREELGLNSQRFAERVGISRQYLQQIEARDAPLPPKIRDRTREALEAIECEAASLRAKLTCHSSKCPRESADA